MGGIKDHCRACVWKSPFKEDGNYGCLKGVEKGFLFGSEFCCFYLDAEKIRRRYATNKNRMEYLFDELRSGTATTAQRKELEKLVDKVRFDEWTLSAVPLSVEKRTQDAQSTSGVAQ